MEIRDLRNGSWYWVNTAINACTHISHADKCVYGALASFGGYTEIRPSFETIAERSNVSLRQAKMSVKNLTDVGYVEVAQGGGRGLSNVYELLKCPKGCKICTVSETVQNSVINGAKFAPHIDIINIDIPYEEEDISIQPINDEGELVVRRKGMKRPVTVAPYEFSYQNELTRLRKSPQILHRIAALYFFYKDMSFDNRDQYEPELARQIKAARGLKGYTGAHVSKVMEHCKKEWGNNWTLETVSRWAPLLQK